MNSLEAKFILESCRSGGLDASDPKIVEALQVMESDPELAHWFAAGQEFDGAVVAKLRAVPTPDDLAARIHAGQTPVAALRRGRRRQWLQLAALLLVLATLAALLLPARQTRFKAGSIAAFRNDMADFMDRRWDRAFDLTEPDFQKLKQWLELRTESIQIDVPPTLASSRTIGCKTLKWHGNTATLICFVPKHAETVVHILVVDRRALTDAPPEKAQHARVTHWNSAIWSRGDKVYLALTTAEPDKLTSCL